MNERDIELAAQAGAHWEHGDWNLASSVHFSEDELHKFADLIRADERNRAMRENAYVLAEREACAAKAEQVGQHKNHIGIAAAIRARGKSDE